MVNVVVWLDRNPVATSASVSVVSSVAEAGRTFRRELRNVLARSKNAGLLTVVTPFSDPIFDAKEYQEFLRSLGFAPAGEAVFGKTRTL